MSTSMFFKLDGNKELSNLEYNKEITLVGKTEITLNEVVDTDGNISIPIDNIGNISSIIVESTDAVLTISDTSPDSNVLKVSGILHYGVDSIYSGTIDGITVSTTDTTGVDIKVILIGE